MMNEKLSLELRQSIAYWHEMQGKVPAAADKFTGYVQVLESIAPAVEALEQENEALKARLAGLGEVIQPFIDVLKHNRYDGDNAIFVERHFDSAAYDLLKLTDSPDFDESEDWLLMEHMWNLAIRWLGEDGESMLIGGNDGAGE